MTLHDVSFDGKSAFYRLSLSEMFAPYGDPRNPIYRKGAFDLGNVVVGMTANNLQCMPYRICRKLYSQHTLPLKQWVAIALVW
ncbi:copper amine oxidase [Aspergillus pseudonomiae]|nr:copper amine oxidase [Aspergillus pseudonomiae]